MKWLYEVSKNIMYLTEDQTKFKADIRRFNQVTVPSGILEMISKDIRIPQNLFPTQASVILQVKAIQMNKTWYRILSKDEIRKRK